MYVHDKLKECEAALAKFEAKARDALAEQEAAHVAFKNDPTDDNRERGERADSAVKYANLAIQGASERLEAARKDVGAADAAVPEIEVALAATSVKAFKEAAAAEFKLWAKLKAQLTEVETKLAAMASHFADARKQGLARALKVGMPMSTMLDYSAIVMAYTVGGSSDFEHVIAPVEALFSGPELVRVKGVLFQLQDAVRRRAYVREAGSQVQLSEVEAEIVGLTAQLRDVGAEALVDTLSVPVTKEQALSEMNNAARQASMQAQVETERSRVARFRLAHQH